MHIKRVEEELKIWGKFWAKQIAKELDYPSVSITYQCSRIMKTGIYSQGTSHLFNSMSDNIYVPEHIKVMDDAIKKLSEKERDNLRLRFINNNKLITKSMIRNAVITLSGLL